jgi:hypothetical protein
MYTDEYNHHIKITELGLEEKKNISCIICQVQNMYHIFQLNDTSKQWVIISLNEEEAKKWTLPYWHRLKAV